PSGELHLPNQLQVIRAYDEGIFTFQIDRVEIFEQNTLSFYTPTTWLEGAFSLEIVSQEDAKSVQDGYLCALRAVTLPLSIRMRRNGDKMTLKGMNGTKKLKDIFIDGKVPKNKRDTWPIVTDARGEILWVPQLKQSSLADRVDEWYILVRYITRRKNSNDER